MARSAKELRPTSVTDHLKRYPKARASTIATKMLVAAKTEQLRRENEARRKQQRTSRLQRLIQIVKEIGGNADKS